MPRCFYLQKCRLLLGRYLVYLAELLYKGFHIGREQVRPIEQGFIVFAPLSCIVGQFFQLLEQAVIAGGDMFKCHEKSHAA
uniref:Uncharacterized protein n=2 Tax=prokaryotic environmental samples TaxID=81490 RepID=B3T3L2_9ZZZZ|nr:hypothetical protein ALOHA_HF4000ANIW133B20ctg3g4 [uncultured marine microorganism HF4000_ANIW133B20]ABZ07621.1 hypothetical protein ALOHA_HF4000ANIW137K11ctg5g12 [uncultured marine microorganism HF4000_ANIW137K11]